MTPTRSLRAHLSTETYGERRVVYKDACLDVAIHRGLGEVRRRHMRAFVVDDDALGMKTRPRAATALGYSIAQTQFIGAHTVIVEG